MDSKRPPNQNKPFVAKAPIRSKSGPYLAPKLAAGVKTSPGPEVVRNIKIAPTNGIERAVNNGSNVATPIKTFLASNVTPRSSSRRSRTGSAASTPNSTPGGTPNSSRPGSINVPNEELQGLGLRNGAGRPTKPESVMSTWTNPSLTRQHSDSRDVNSPNTGTPVFFHASDASSVPWQAQPIPKSTPGFVYADGRQEPPSSYVGSVGSSKSISQVGMQAKLYQASSKPEMSPILSTSPTRVSPASSPKLVAPIISPSFQTSRQRSTSPLKEFEIPGEQAFSKARRTSGASNVSFRSAIKSTVPPAAVRQPPATSLTEIQTHARTQSITSTDAFSRPLSTPVRTDTSSFALPSPRDPLVSPNILSLQTAQLSPATASVSPLTSPNHVKSVGGDDKIEQLNAMAANARRERKVLDLEISNSSLLAINRTLEREMRKQKAELRRYRRLTSGGRLSFVPTERSVSGTTTISTLSLDSDLTFGSDEDNTLTDIASEDEEEDLDDSDDSSLSLSPEAQAARDIRQRTRDEKRLQLDLSKHQQILIDSQKMNESLKRCLGWTEELISEGKKALEYQIRVSEITMGGRVLHQDDLLDMQDTQPRRGLLSPSADANNVDGLSWSPDTSPSGTIIRRTGDECNTVIADESKEFRHYLDSLAEPAA